MEKLEAYDDLERDEWREKINIDKFVYEDSTYQLEFIVKVSGRVNQSGQQVHTHPHFGVSDPNCITWIL